MAILDSGNRHTFESGAVRDVQEGKGRCDLLPLKETSELLAMAVGHTEISDIVLKIADFVSNGEYEVLYDALYDFIELCYGGGCVPGAILEVSKHFEEGAKKYGEYNWQKGIPLPRYIDSAVRHYLKWLRGDTDEPHDRAFCWNILCAIWTCEHKPELNTYRRGESE